MAGDVLSDVMRVVEMRGAVFVDVDVSAPWSARTPEAAKLRPAVMPAAQHLMSFHLVTEGDVWVLSSGGAIQAGAGDMVFFPGGEEHVVCSDPTTPVSRGIDAFRLRASVQWPHVIRGGGGGADGARMICGFLGCCSGPFNPLVSALPPLMHIRKEDGRDDAFSSLYALAVREAEAKRAGGEAVLGNLGELLFIAAVRRHMEALAPDSLGWLAGLRDTNVGRVLTAIHAEPSRRWNLAALAREAGLSRTRLADRFTHLVGVPPIRYLANWRIQVGARMLARPDQNIASVAAAVGYESEAAFSRAFKRLTGQSPSEWRRSQQG